MGLEFQMLDFLKRLVKIKESPEPLDPYLVGRIAGPAAFATDDWVVLRLCENKPARVRRDPSDFPGAVRVILGNPSDGMYAETCYCASDLGYPLSKDLWSQSQLEWYQKCHEDENLVNSRRWAKVHALKEIEEADESRVDIHKHLDRYSQTVNHQLRFTEISPSSICLSIEHHSQKFTLLGAPLLVYIDLIKDLFKADKFTVVDGDFVALIDKIDRIVIEVSYDGCPFICAITEDLGGKPEKQSETEIFRADKRRKYKIDIPANTRTLGLKISRLDQAQSHLHVSHCILDFATK
jgi:hypothetical protein